MKENIEEDMKIVQEFLIEQNKRKQRLIDNPYRQLFYTDEELQAIEHILSDYKRLQEEFRQVDHECERLEQKELRLEKENEEWQRAYQEEKDKQFELLRETQLAKEALKKQCDIADERNQLLIENQKLQKENEELKHKYDKALSDLVKAEEENKELKRLIAHKNGYTQQLEKDLFENCSNYVISKQKVKDKIEELKEERASKYDSYMGYKIESREQQDIDKEINALQDLLEEKGE